MFYKIIINFILMTYVIGASLNLSFDMYESHSRMQRDVEDAVVEPNNDINATEQAPPPEVTKRPYDVMVDVNSVKNESDSDLDVDDEDIVTTTHKIVPIIPGNDLYIGNCSDKDKMLYIDNTVITNDGPSILNGTIEVIF